ncbi:hypothetical protein [Candidatus Amarobacter glycogenicus]|uniref:hypothetical protein n=1 Tax=Candidatus Amarobacter glycogenicus TaxID=3140699 RepID=UPI002A0E56AF|nr:hypothetical protein [Dehalococcoidia bacterium]
MSGDASLLGYFHSNGFATYPGLGWGVIATQDQDEALSAASALTTRILIVAAIARCSSWALRRFSRVVRAPSAVVSPSHHETLANLRRASARRRQPSCAGSGLGPHPQSCDR